MATRKYDSMVARIAGNIASGLIRNPDGYYGAVNEALNIAEMSVNLARAIVAATERTEPVNPVDSVDTRNPSGR